MAEECEVEGIEEWKEGGEVAVAPMLDVTNTLRRVMGVTGRFQRL